MQKVGIVGAGITGRLIAFECARRGMTVTIFDEHARDAMDSCAHAAAAMLAPICEYAHADELVYRLGVDSLSRWVDLIHLLDQHIFFQTEGTLIVSHHQDVAELTHLSERLSRKLAKIAAPAGTVELLHRQAIVELEPALGERFSTGLLVRNEGQVDNRQVMSALGQRLVEHAVEWFDSEKVESVEPHTVRTQRGVRKFDYVVDCRGVGASPEVDGIRGVRGELVVIETNGVRLRRPVRLLHARWPIYVVPRPQHKFIIGASSIESDDMSRISVQSLLELLASSVSLNPAFLSASLVETRVHCRPAYEDNIPRIDRAEGLLRVNGLYRHGFLCGPSIAHVAASLIEGSDAEIDLSDCPEKLVRMLAVGGAMAEARQIMPSL
jgi:glycine oxidase